MSSPRRIDEIELEWLNETLRESGVLGDAHVRSFHAAPVPKQGMTSLAHVVTLDYDERSETAPGSLIAKFSLDAPPIQEAMASNRGFEREVAFYQGPGRDAGIPVPRCFWADYDPESNSCGLLLEFVEGMRTTDVFSGTVDEIELVVDRLAPFHSKWWGRTDGLQGIPPGQSPFMLELYKARLVPALDNIKDRYRVEAGETLVELIELWLDQAEKLARHEAAKPQTLCHGDLHREQVLFPAAAGGTPCVIDWQLAAADTGPTDLAHLLLSGLHPEQRQREETHLVERYHAGLLESGVQGWSLDDTWESYKQGLARLALFYLTAFAAGDMAPIIAWWDSDEKRRGTSFWDVSCGRPAQAIEQHGVLDLFRRIAGD